MIFSIRPIHLLLAVSTLVTSLSAAVQAAPSVIQATVPAAPWVAGKSYEIHITSPDRAARAAQGWTDVIIEMTGPAKATTTVKVCGMRTKSLYDPGVVWATPPATTAEGSYVFTIKGFNEANPGNVLGEKKVTIAVNAAPIGAPIDITAGVLVTPDTATKDLLVKDLNFKFKPFARIKNGVLVVEKHPENHLLDGGKPVRPADEVKVVRKKVYYLDKGLSAGQVVGAKGTVAENLSRGGNIVAVNGTAAEFTTGRLRLVINHFGGPAGLLDRNKMMGSVIAAAGCPGDGHVFVLQAPVSNLDLPPLVELKTVGEVEAKIKAGYKFR